MGLRGSLWAVGGHSGYSQNHSSFCGGGGGGGVIQVFSTADVEGYIANNSIHTRGGHGMQGGEDGMEEIAGKYVPNFCPRRVLAQMAKTRGGTLEVPAY